MSVKEKAHIMDEAAMERALVRIAHQIVEKNHGTDHLCLVGIKTRGVPLAQRLGRNISRLEGVDIPVGELDITLYRDDLSTIAEAPVVSGTHVPFSVEGMTVVLVDDVIFSLLLFLFIVFSFVFRTNFQLFVKMLKDAFLVKERQNLFDDVIGKSIFFFRNFMTFQVLFLSSIALIAVGRIYGFVNYAEWQAVLSAIGTVFCVLFLFYQFKQCCYYLLGSVFSDPDKYKLWKTSYNAIMGIWGVSLYVPVLWLVFVGTQVTIPITMFCSPVSGMICLRSGL